MATSYVSRWPNIDRYLRSKRVGIRFMMRRKIRTKYMRAYAARLREEAWELRVVAAAQGVDLSDVEKLGAFLASVK